MGILKSYKQYLKNDGEDLQESLAFSIEGPEYKKTIEELRKRRDADENMTADEYYAEKDAAELKDTLHALAGMGFKNVEVLEGEYTIRLGNNSNIVISPNRIGGFGVWIKSRLFLSGHNHDETVVKILKALAGIKFN